MSTVAEIKAAIETLPPKQRADLERWLWDSATSADDEAIPHEPSDINPDEDSPELEAGHLKGLESPSRPFDPAELHAIGERIIKEHRAAKSA